MLATLIQTYDKQNIISVLIQIKNKRQTQNLQYVYV